MHAASDTREPQITRWRARLAGIDLRILIVDDDAPIRALWHAILADAAPAAQLVETADGVNGIRMAKEFQPHIILMDLAMPVMGGLEATRCIKADPATARIPVIAVTGAGCAVQDVLDAGCDGYLIKPIDPEALVAEVVHHLRLPSE